VSYFSFLKTYGAIAKGVPQQDCKTPSTPALAIPKSAILKSY
jgi:hypothetical protein